MSHVCGLQGFNPMLGGWLAPKRKARTKQSEATGMSPPLECGSHGHDNSHGHVSGHKPRRFPKTRQGAAMTTREYIIMRGRLLMDIDKRRIAGNCSSIMARVERQILSRELGALEQEWIANPAPGQVRPVLMPVPVEIAGAEGSGEAEFDGLEAL